MVIDILKESEKLGIVDSKDDNIQEDEIDIVIKNAVSKYIEIT